jgi:antitoxin VapB
MSILSVETERLIERTARTHGRSPDQIVQEALDVAFRKSPTSDWKALSKEERIIRLEEFSQRAASRPILDTRSDEDILGFDENGLPR